MYNIPQKFDGISVLPAAEFNSLVDELKNIITSSGQALTGADVAQIAKGIANYVMNGNYFTDSGVANAYLLGVVGAKFAPTLYADGFTVMFKVGNTNTGASTVNVAGLGIKYIKKNNGASDLDNGDLVAGNVVEIVYNLSGDYFELTRTEFVAADFLRRDVTNNITVGYTTTAFSLGNSGTGTVTPVIANGHIQTLTINGNFTLGTPTDAQSGIIEIQATNASGGFSINTGTYTIVENNFDNSNGKVNLIRILKIGSTSYLSINPVPIVTSSNTSMGLNNVVINPEMIISQRGTSFAVPASPSTANVYTVDRWQLRKLGSMAVTLSQDTDVPTVLQASYLFRNSIKNTTTATYSPSSTNGHGIVQPIEGYNWSTVAQRTVSVGFWAKSSMTGTYCVALINTGPDRSCVLEYTINAANTWEYKTVTFPASPSSGTWNYTNGIGAYLYFTLSSSSGVITTPGSWQTGNFYGTTNQINHASVNGSTFNLTGVTLVAGSTVPPFQARQFEQELTLCQRYYEKSYELDVIPGTANPSGGRDSSTQSATGNGSNRYFESFGYLTKKRAPATVSIYSHYLGTPGNVTQDTTTNTPATVIQTGVSEYRIRFVNASGDFGALHQFTADCEL